MSRRATPSFTGGSGLSERITRSMFGKKGPFVKQNHRIKLLEDIGVDLDPLDML